MAAPAPSPAAASSSSSSSSSGVATIGPPECPICTEAFECDEAADPAACRLPRTLPCTHSVCSACLIRLLEATPGRVKCPTCRADHALQRPPGAASAADHVRLIPQNADTVQLIRRSAQLEAALQEQQWVQVQHSSPRCAFGSGCADLAVRWCDDCDAAWCANHDAFVHGLALAAHRRMTLGEKEAARQTKVAAALAAAGASLKASATTTVQKQQSAVKRLEAEEAQQRRALAAQQRAIEEKKRQLDGARARLAQIQASANRLLGLSDIEAQQQSGSFPDLILFPPGASGLLASLTGQQLGHLCRFLGGERMPAVCLMYRASRDGFKAADLCRCCAGRSPTLTLVKVADNGFVFGVFTPLSWPDNAVSRNAHMADPSGRTFLFSLVNAHGRAVKLRLKADHRDKAFIMSGGAYGPAFGCGADLFLMRGAAADKPRGCLTCPSSFELDQEAEAAAGLPPIPFAYDQTLLAGDDDGNHDNNSDGEDYVSFAAAEIEVYQL